ncbi:MAG: hypothetical protein LBH62_03595 [Nitrososphaerota archaeon]|nr:hypothetical protein [Candidatus Termiticorpusculum sp.]MDR0460509.1 hypothetical protein [Nitrososphaerota archaeon]
MLHFYKEKTGAKIESKFMHRQDLSLLATNTAGVQRLKSAIAEARGVNALLAVLAGTCGVFFVNRAFK